MTTKITIRTEPLHDPAHTASYMSRTFDSADEAEGWMYDQEEVRFFQVYPEKEYEITDIERWAHNHRIADADAPFPGFDPWDEMGAPMPVKHKFAVGDEVVIPENGKFLITGPGTVDNIDPETGYVGVRLRSGTVINCPTESLLSPSDPGINEPGTTEWDNFLSHIEHEAVIVGRHTPEGLPQNIRIHRQFDITWSTDAGECARQWQELREEVKNLPQYQPGMKIILQNVPAILAAVLLKTPGVARGVGIIVSKPGERKAGVEKIYRFAEMAENSYTSAVSDARAAERLVKEVNPRAKTSVEGDDLNAKLIVTMDPPTPFVFDHIEWL